MSPHELGIERIAVFAPAALAAIVLPGPGQMSILLATSEGGIRCGYAALAGLVLGDTLLMLTAAGGAGAALDAFPGLFLWVRILGASYLAYLGSRLVVARPRPEPAFQADPPADSSRGESLSAASPKRAFLRSLGVTLSNPKAILFFLALLPQFVAADAPRPARAFIALGLLFDLLSLLFHTGTILAGAAAVSALRRHPRLSRRLGLAAGLLFIAIAIALVLD